MKKQTILWDMDQCLARMVKSILDHLNLKYKDVQFPEENVITWSFWEKLPDKRIGAEAFEYMHRPGFFAQLEPYEIAVDVFKKTVDLGHNSIICTTPTRGLSRDQCIEDKKIWAEYFLGKEHVPNMIFTDKKTEVKGDVIIDDNPKLTFEKNNIQFNNWLIIDHPYNQHIPETAMEPVGRIMRDWSNWEEEFQKLDLI